MTSTIKDSQNWPVDKNMEYYRPLIDWVSVFGRKRNTYLGKKFPEVNNAWDYWYVSLQTLPLPPKHVEVGT